MTRWFSNATGQTLGSKLETLIAESGRVWLISPFVSEDGLEIFLGSASKAKDVRQITRLNDNEVDLVKPRRFRRLHGVFSHHGSERNRRELDVGPPQQVGREAGTPEGLVLVAINQRGLTSDA